MKAWQEDASSGGSSSSSSSIRRSRFMMDGRREKWPRMEGFSKPHSSFIYFSARTRKQSLHQRHYKICSRNDLYEEGHRTAEPLGSSVTLHRSISGMLKDYLNALLLALDPSDGERCSIVFSVLLLTPPSISCLTPAFARLLVHSFTFKPR